MRLDARREDPAEASCRIRLDFFSSRAPVQASDKAFVAQELDAYVDWGKRHNVPLFLGEWGAIRFAFDNDRGGLRWVGDMLDLLRRAACRLRTTRITRTRSAFTAAAARCPTPRKANAPLIELFTEKLASRARK